MGLTKHVVGVLGIACLLALCPVVAQGALVNGTFSGIEGWTFVGSASTNGDVSHTADGSGSAYVYMIVPGGAADKAQQSIAVAANVDYTLAWYSTIDQCSNSSGVIRVYGVLESGDVEITSGNFAPGASWTSHSIDFNTASYDQVKISFEPAVTAYDQYYRIDDVTLVPEPATLGLLGLGVLAWARKRS
jgi:hypothetical protein